MKSVVSVRRWTTGVVVAAIVTLGAASSAAASGASIWSKPVPYSSGLTIFESISCASASNCVAAGTSAASLTGGGAAIVAESGGAWGSIATLTKLPVGAVVLLKSVSCASTTSCVAVGTARGGTEGAGVVSAIVVPLSVSGSTVTGAVATVIAPPEGAKTGAEENVSLSSVSCASTSDCTAVGSFLDKSGQRQPMVATMGAGGAWKSVAVTPPSAAEGGAARLAAISCPSSGPCEAVGSYERSADSYPWAVQITEGVAATGEAVTPPSGFAPTKFEEESETGFLGLSASGLAAISCPSAGACTAAGSFTTTGVKPVVVPISNGTPGAAVDLAPGGLEDLLVGISCSDATDCEVAGLGATPAPAVILASETGGTWSSIEPLPAEGSGITLPSSMSCAVAGRCVLTGIEASSLESIASLSAFFAYSAPPLSVATSSLPAATVGVPYSAALQATGGTGSQTWSLPSGALPAGLSLNAATGVISGTPTANGQSGFSVDAIAAEPPSQTASASLSISVAAAPPAPPPPTLVSAVSLVSATTSGKTATVVLSCSGAPCVGTVEITAVERLEARKAIAAAFVAKKKRKKRKAKASTKQITLATGSYSIAAGGTEVLTLPLTSEAGALLTKLGTATGELSVTPAGASTAAIVQKLTFESTAKGKHRSKKHKKNKSKKHKSKKHKSHKKKKHKKKK